MLLAVALLAAAICLSVLLWNAHSPTQTVALWVARRPTPVRAAAERVLLLS